MGDDARYMEILLAFHVKYEQKTTGPWSEKGFDWWSEFTKEVRCKPDVHANDQILGEGTMLK